MRGLKFHQYVNVTLGCEFVSQYRAKESQLAYVMPAAEVNHRLLIELDISLSHGTNIPFAGRHVKLLMV